jgi:glucose uptake protein
MLVPSTYTGALLLTILTMICWGSWANTMKLCGKKWRFELFYFDYAIGVFIAALVAGVTFGSIDGGAAADGIPVFSFWDNLLIAFKRYIGFAFLSGVVFNLANMLLVAAIAVAGLSVAFPIGIGLALIIGVVWSFILNPQGNPTFLFGGMVVLLAAIVVAALAHKTHLETKPAPKPKPGAPPRAPAPPASPWKGIVLSLISGVLMGSFYPLLEMSKHEFGLGPYAAVFIFTAGVLVSTPVFNIFFMNVPVQGDPVGFGAYFKGKFSWHLLGLLGGVIWCIGMVANFVAAATPKSINVGPAVSYAIGQGATLVSTLWGLLVWHEFKNAVPRTRKLVGMMLALFVIGLGLIAVAPLFKK